MVITPSSRQTGLLIFSEALLVAADRVHSNGQVVGQHNLMVPSKPMAVLVGE